MTRIQWKVKDPVFFFRGSIWLSVLQWGLISHFHLPGCKQFLQTNPRINGYTGTPPKINIEPENDGFEDDVPFQLGKFKVHVNLPGCILIIKSASQDKKSNLDSFLKPEWRLITFHHFHPSFSSTRVLLQYFPITLKCLPLPFHDFSPALFPLITIHLPKREMFSRYGKWNLTSSIFILHLLTLWCYFWPSRGKTLSHCQCRARQDQWSAACHCWHRRCSLKTSNPKGLKELTYSTRW